MRKSSGACWRKACFCLPLFSLEEYDREFVTSLRSLKYESAFYLPAEATFGIEESFIRFDRGQMVHCHHLKRWRSPTKLHEDALLVLQEWFRYYTTGYAEDWILRYQKTELGKLQQVSAGLESGTNNKDQKTSSYFGLFSLIELFS